MLLDTKKTIAANELQHTFNWEFILPSDISGVDSMEISSLITDVKFGNYNITSPYALRFGPYQSFSAGFFELGQASITLLASSNGKVYQYFQDWKDKIINPAGYYYPKANYVRTCYCNLADRKGVTQTSYKLINCFPVNFPSFNLSYREEDFLRFNVNFALDAVELA